MSDLPDFWITTVRRLAPPEFGGGISHVVSDAVVQADWVVPKSPEIDEAANPRGGVRGARGITRTDDGHIIVASYHSLLIYNSESQQVDRHSHPLMSGIHAIACEGPVVWVTSTSIDVLLGYNLETREVEEVFDLTTLASVRALGVAPRGLDLSADYRADPSVVRGDSTHLNSVLKMDDTLYVLLNRFGVIVDVRADRVVARHDLLRGAHDLVYIPERDQIAVNDTRSQSLLLFDRQTFSLVDRIRIARLKGAPWWLTTEKLKLLCQKVVSRLFKIRVNASPLFMRGLAYENGRIYSGTSPAAVFVTCLDTRQIVGQHRFSRKTTDTIYGILPASGPRA